MGKHFEARVYVDGTRVAGADLSANQYKFVKLNASGAAIAIAADTDVPYGVQQNQPKSGEAVEIIRVGASRVVGAADLSVGNFIGPSANGRAALRTLGTDVTKFVAGTVIEDNGAVDGIITASIDCMVPSRAA
jgi:hypothetical protein